MIFILKEDMEHKLLKGSIIYLGDIPTYKVTLGQMVDFQYGYTKCQQVINILCMEDEKTQDILSGKLEPTTWNFIIAMIYTELKTIQDDNDEDIDTNDFLLFVLPQFLELVFHKNVTFSFKNGCFVIGNNEHILDESNFNEFRDILCKRNCICGNSEDDENPENAMVKALLDRKRELKERLKKHKLKQQMQDGDEDRITLFDLISIFSEAIHVTPEYVYDKYDMYQFNNQFNRLRIMLDYDINIRYIIAGAKIEDVKLQHWISKIKNSNE